MLTTVQGIYENGELELTEAPPTLEKSKGFFWRKKKKWLKHKNGFREV